MVALHVFRLSCTENRREKWNERRKKPKRLPRHWNRRVYGPFVFIIDSFFRLSLARLMCTFANSELISNEEENCYALIQSDIKMFMVQYSAVLYFDCECLSLQYELWTMHIWIWWTNNFWLCGYKIQCAVIMIDENGHELTIDALISECGNTLLEWNIQFQRWNWFEELNANVYSSSFLARKSAQLK